MASDEPLNFEGLLTPISEDAPSGEELRSADAEAYWEIKRLRDAARKDESQSPGGGSDTTTAPEWAEVFQLSEEVLTESSKDLQVTAWMIEALVRLEGFSGLRDGLKLFGELCNQFWDDIHPHPDEDGVATTVAPMAGLNGEDADGPLIIAINRIPVTEGNSQGPYALCHLAQAYDLDQKSELREQRLADGWISREMFDAAVGESSSEFLQSLLDDVADCQATLAEMESTLEEKCDKDDNGISLAPSTSRIREALDDSLRTIRGFAGEILGEDFDDDDTGNPDAASGGAGGSTAATGGVSSRAEAYKTLMEVARFFRKSEPHSPVSYALEQVVKWGKMSLPDLLKELIQDSSARDAMFRHVGISESEQQDDHSSSYDDNDGDNDE